MKGVKITKIFKRNVSNMPLYNFSVEDDESYIANGIVSHNCRCSTIEYLPDSQDEVMSTLANTSPIATAVDNVDE